MITEITGLPETMVGFRADGEVTKDDFEKVHARVAALVEKQGKLNYMLVLDNSPKDFTLGAWMQDALLGIKHITKWNRAAIVSDIDGVITFTDGFSKVMPGEFRGYKKAEYEAAVSWVSGNADN